MGCRIIEGTADGDKPCAVMYDSVSGRAFGPLFADREEVEHFMTYCETDPRRLTDSELTAVYLRWCKVWLAAHLTDEDLETITKRYR